jgi:PAS domain S-box-containing protein
MPLNKIIATPEELYHQAPCGYLSYLDNGLIIQINATLLQWLGYQQDEVVDVLSLQDLLSVGSKIYYETHYAPLLQMQGSVQEISLEMLGKNRQKIPVLMNSRVVRNSQNSAVLVHATIFNITQRKAYEQELLKAKYEAEEANQKLKEVNAELERFAYVVSHDLKAPLNNIIQLVNLLGDDPAFQLNTESLFLLQLIQLSTDKLKQLVDGILYYSRNVGSAKNLPERVVLQDFFQSIHLLVNPQNTHDISYPTAEVCIITHRTILEQIFLNLITNAIKYNDKPKVVITIELKEDENFYYFSVKDNGIGIPEAHQDKIFQLFTTLESEDRYGKKGTGVGLFTVKKLVEKLDGEITVQSALNEGTTFSFSVKKIVVP